eukprot:TRINITY_DN1307_c0_g1_i3.p1 TRINITY_DN1307_c0_g1~~TRINITY_DN1307_c0_g1_i3.p1  ORF type:complete len:598 (+),score=89.20 TRINITY_DN1307_c0_g1_i3:30-1796(+)
MDVLQSMFPDVSETILREVFQSVDGDLSRAADWILAGRHLENSPSQNSSSNIKSENSTNVLKPAVISVGSKSILARGLKAILLDGDFADVSLVCKDGEVLAHACILCARSEYLAALLSSIEAQSGQMRRLELLDFEASVIQLVLEYLYFDKVNIPQHLQWKLNSVASELGISRLRRMSEGSLPEESTYMEDLFKLRQNPGDYFSDGFLVIEGSKLPIHKVVIAAACDYFKALWTVNMAEQKMDAIPVEDISKETFNLFLDVIYRDGHTKSESITPENAVDMFLLANRMIVPSLQIFCEDIINNNIEEENACEILEIAWSLSSTLRHNTLQFIFSHWEKIQLTDGFKQLPPAMAVELKQRYDQESENTLLNLLRAVSDHEVSDIRGSIRMEVFEFLKDQLDEMNVGDEEGVADTPFGDVEWRMSNLRVSTGDPDEQDNFVPFLKPEDIDVIFDHKQLTIAVTNLRVEMKEIKWWYKRLSFPRVEDDGEASAAVSGVSIKLCFNIVSQLLGIPLLEVDHFNVNVGQFDLRLRNSKVDFLYNIFAKVFKDKIRSSVQRDLEQLFQDSLLHLTKNINELSRNLAEGSNFRRY